MIAIEIPERFGKPQEKYRVVIKTPYGHELRGVDLYTTSSEADSEVKFLSDLLPPDWHVNRQRVWS